MLWTLLLTCMCVCVTADHSAELGEYSHVQDSKTQIGIEKVEEPTFPEDRKPTHVRRVGVRFPEARSTVRPATAAGRGPPASGPEVNVPFRGSGKSELVVRARGGPQPTTTGLGTGGRSGPEDTQDLLSQSSPVGWLQEKVDSGSKVSSTQTLIPPSQGSTGARGPETPSGLVFNNDPDTARRPSHLTVPASTVHPIYRVPVDDDPNKWVTPQPFPLPLPRRIIVPLTFDGTNYLGAMTVGTPKPGREEQQLKVVFDTGSKLLWVVSKDACDKALCSEGNTSFDKESSATYKTTGSPLRSVFAGIAAIAGIISEDHIAVGEGQNRLIIKNQQFGEASDFKEVFSDYDALFGLDLVAPPFMYGQPESPLYHMTRQFGTAPVFGLYINRYTPNKSRIVFGGGDEEFVVGPFNSHPVQKVDVNGMGKWYNGWNVNVDRIVVEAPGSAPIVVHVSDDLCAHPDTGSSLIYGPERLIRKLNAEIFRFRRFQVNEDFTFSCDEDLVETINYFPDVHIVMDGSRYTLKPTDYLGNLEGECTSFFKGQDTYGHILLGRTFLQKYYARFDHGNKLVQFA